MIKEEILQLLFRYHPKDPWEVECRQRIIDFIQSGAVFLGSSNPEGHLTGSAWIVNTDRTKVLLTHHAALNLWLQLGGHTEEDEHVLDTALREAQEESGLSSLKLLSGEIFDIDIHEIPARGSKAAHYHYDIRFLLEGDENEKLIISEESQDLQWVPLERVGEYTNERSVLRMVEKMRGE